MLALALLLLQITSALPTCLLQSKSIFGDKTGLDFTDVAVLKESENFVYRLNKISVCGDQAGRLKGFQIQVGLYVGTALKGSRDLTKVGTIQDDCVSLKVNPNLEFIRTVTIRYDENQIQYIQFVSSSGEQISMGVSQLATIQTIFTFTEENQLLGWWGTRTTIVKSIGPITVNTKCFITSEAIPVAYSWAQIEPEVAADSSLIRLQMLWIILGCVCTILILLIIGYACYVQDDEQTEFEISVESKIDSSSDRQASDSENTRREQSSSSSESESIRQDVNEAFTSEDSSVGASSQEGSSVQIHNEAPEGLSAKDSTLP